MFWFGLKKRTDNLGVQDETEISYENKVKEFEKRITQLECDHSKLVFEEVHMGGYTIYQYVKKCSLCGKELVRYLGQEGRRDWVEDHLKHVGQQYKKLTSRLQRDLMEVKEVIDGKE